MTVRSFPTIRCGVYPSCLYPGDDGANLFLEPHPAPMTMIMNISRRSVVYLCTLGRYHYMDFAPFFFPPRRAVSSIPCRFAGERRQHEEASCICSYRAVRRGDPRRPPSPLITIGTNRVPGRAAPTTPPPPPPARGRGAAAPARRCSASRTSSGHGRLLSQQRYRRVEGVRLRGKFRPSGSVSACRPYSPSTAPSAAFGANHGSDEATVVPMTIGVRLIIPHTRSSRPYEGPGWASTSQSE